ncbi:MAG: hypothetical protein NZZ41_00175 [Candidatus Dojkabacteria bacterium]|nr:hypothetical protein [Candidatus Dojkabacteria bacterium]
MENNFQKSVNEVFKFLKKTADKLNIRTLDDSDFLDQARRIVKNEIVLKKTSSQKILKPIMNQSTPVSTKIGYYLSSIIESLPLRDKVLYIIGARILDKLEEYNYNKNVAYFLNSDEINKFLKFMFTRFKTHIAESLKNNYKNSLLNEEYQNIVRWTKSFNLKKK